MNTLELLNEYKGIKKLVEFVSLFDDIKITTINNIICINDIIKITVNNVHIVIDTTEDKFDNKQISLIISFFSSLSKSCNVKFHKNRIFNHEELLTLNCMLISVGYYHRNVLFVSILNCLFNHIKLFDFKNVLNGFRNIKLISEDFVDKKIYGRDIYDGNFYQEVEISNIINIKVRYTKKHKIYNLEVSYKDEIISGEFERNFYVNEEGSYVNFLLHKFIHNNSVCNYLDFLEKIYLLLK
jgi:hypothetical protein